MTNEEKLAEEYRKELKERLLRNDDYERLEMFDENVEEAYLAGRKSNSEAITELENEVLRLTDENKILTNENKILKQGKTNVFAELNDETAKSNEMLMDKVADLEAQIEKMKCCGSCRFSESDKLNGTFCHREGCFVVASAKCKLWED